MVLMMMVATDVRKGDWGQGLTCGYAGWQLNGFDSVSDTWLSQLFMHMLAGSSFCRCAAAAGMLY